MIGNTVYNFDLDESRRALQLSGPLKDKIADDLTELKSSIFGIGFGRITDIEIGHGGYLYILSAENERAIIYKVIPS